MKTTRNLWIVAILTLAVPGLLTRNVQTLDAQEPTMTVYRNAGCGCCAKWADAMGDLGVRVSVVNVDDLNQFKSEYGVPESLYSCHTAVIGFHLVEGHVPPRMALRLLDDLSEYRGIAVAGMPRGSAGMGGAMGRGIQDAYEVVGFKRDGELTVLARR